MDLVGAIFRPPSEAHSLLLQVTLGCSHNRCGYCSMYDDKPFRVKPWAQVRADVREAAAAGPRHRRLFLCDGDALILPTTRLLQILNAVRAELPWIERVGTYGDTRSVGRKSATELRALKEAGLGIVYHGVESGDDETLRAIHKGGTRAECVDTAAKLRSADILHSVIVLLGVGGVARSEIHARETASLLTLMDPPLVGALTLTVVPETPIYARQQAGAFQLPDPWRLLEELRILVAHSALSGCRFSSNHASNYLPIRCTLPRDREAVLRALDEVLDARDEGQLKPEWMRGL